LARFVFGNDRWKRTDNEYPDVYISASQNLGSSGGYISEDVAHRNVVYFIKETPREKWTFPLVKYIDFLFADAFDA
jgi:hypothetical protein